MSWYPDGTGIHDGGDVGGDYQATKAYDVRFRHRTQEDALVTVTGYGVYGKVDGMDGHTGPNSGPYTVELQVEELICTDMLDPGSSETWSDVYCLHLDGGYDKADVAELAAWQAVKDFRPEEIKWDGFAPWDRRQARQEGR